ncbi:MAG: ATP-binding protein [Verrucomicrobiota bacterium]
MDKGSIKWRIQKWNAVLLVTLAGVMAAGFFVYEREMRLRRLESELSSLTGSIIPRTLSPSRHGPRGREGGERRGPEGRGLERSDSRPPLREILDRPEIRTVDQILGDTDFYFIVWDRDGSVIARSGNARDREAFSVEGLPVAETVIFRTDDSIEARHALPGRRRLVIAYPMESFNAEVWMFGLVLTLGSAIVVILGVLIGWILIGRETDQIRIISDSAVRIAGGDLTQRVPEGDSGTELKELVRVLNEAFSKIENSFEQQVRFTADASHELRTPLTALLAKCQSALMRERTSEQYRKAIETCYGVGTQMKKIIQSLLDLARIDSGENALALKRTELSEIVAESVRMLHPLIEQKCLFFESDLSKIEAEVDGLRFLQICSNLIGNAVKFSSQGGTVHLRLFVEKEVVCLVVADRGPGIPEDEMESLFDRFFTGKAKMQNSVESTGLGLAVVKAIVAAHGGSIAASNRVSGGAAFRVELPVSKSVAKESET